MLDNNLIVNTNTGEWLHYLKYNLYDILMRSLIKLRIINYIITITMLLCKELILIRGQPPRQGGSPRATLDHGGLM